MAIQWIKFKDSLRTKVSWHMNGFARSKPDVFPIVYDQLGRIYPEYPISGQLELGMEIGFFANFKIIGQDHWSPRWYCSTIIFKDDVYCWAWTGKRMCSNDRHRRYYNNPPWLTIGDRNRLFEIATGISLDEVDDESEQG